MQGIDIFDMRPLPSDRVGMEIHATVRPNRSADCEIGTFEDPIVVNSAGEELQCGCTGCPEDSHHVRWVVVGGPTECTEATDLTCTRFPAIGHMSDVTNAAVSTR
jgi:hypothetical protein